jgi:hypothetical protein
MSAKRVPRVMRVAPVLDHERTLRARLAEQASASGRGSRAATPLRAGV